MNEMPKNAVSTFFGSKTVELSPGSMGAMWDLIL